jgi:hypothetical protein
VSQFEQENDVGRGGGEVDDGALEKAWRDREERLGGEDAADSAPEADEEVERRS